MISKSAMDRKRVPEKVIAILIIDPYLKHFIPEINLPKSTTSVKNTNMSIIFITVVTSICLNVIIINLYFLYCITKIILK